MPSLRQSEGFFLSIAESCFDRGPFCPCHVEARGVAGTHLECLLYCGRTTISIVWPDQKNGTREHYLFVFVFVGVRLLVRGGKSDRGESTRNSSSYHPQLTNMYYG